MQFKPTIKGIWKVWHGPFFFVALQVSYKVHQARGAEEAIRKNSRNLRKVSAFSFKKRAFIRKVGAAMLMYNFKFLGDWPKSFGAKVAVKGFFNYWGYG